MPADAPARNIARILAKLPDEEGAAIIRDAIDTALFRVFYLLSDASDLDGLSAKIVEVADCDNNHDDLLHETYRMMVDPGGTLVSDEG